MKRFVATFFGLVIIGLFGLSCRIGLGPAIDTQPPEITVFQPESDTVIRDKIGFRGQWTDDGVIKSVTITLTSTNDPNNTFTYDADVEGDEKEGTWSCVINPFDSDAPVKDGTYEASIVITDTSMHSTTVTRLFTVDNTAPLVVLQRPSSKASTPASDWDSYGQTFTLEGQAADDNNIELIEVNFYSDAECTSESLLHTVKMTNVPPTISLDVAKFVENEENDYSKIYGSTKKDGVKSFYCKIVAYDGAQKYPVDGSAQTEADKKGNAVASYYLYDDISAGILSAYKITDVYHMLNGSYKGSDRAAEITSSVKNILSENTVVVGCFNLNPANNPTFLVSGKDQLKKNGKDFTANEDYYISNGSTVVVEVSQGLDGIPLDGDSLKVYVRECNEAGVALPNSQKIYPVTTRSKSGSSYKFVTEINTSSCKALVLGSNYVFGVDGTDMAQNPVFPSGNGYGFHFASSGAAPVLTLTEPADNITYVKKGDTVVIKGTAVVEDGLPVVTIANGKNNVFTSNFKAADATLLSDGKSEYAFAYQVPKNSEGFSQNESKQYNFTIKASKDGNASQATKTVMYDIEGPEASIQSVTPIAHKYPSDESSTPEETDYLNNIVDITVSIADKFDTVDTATNKPYLEFKQNGAVVLTKSITNPIKQTISVDTTDSKFTDGQPVTISIKSWDRAGNENPVTADSTKTFTISQATDKPIALPSDNSKLSLKFKDKAELEGYNNNHRDDPKNKISAGSGIPFRFVDDDGIAEIIISYKSENSDWKSSPAITVANLTEYLYTYTSLPTTTGVYGIKYQIKDKFGKVWGADGDAATKYPEFVVQVVAAAPIIAVTSADTTTFVKENGKVRNRITIDSDSVPFKLYRTTKDVNGNLNWSAAPLVSGIGETVNTIKNSDGHYEVIDEIDITSTATYFYKVSDNSPSDSNVVNITNKVDKDKPTVTLSASPNKEETKGNSYTFSGTSNDGEGSGIEKVQLTISNPDGTNAKTVTVNGTEDWSYTLKFDDSAWAELFAAGKQGTKKVTVVAEDKVGNKSEKFTFKQNIPATEETAVTFIYDKADPILTVNGIQSFIPKAGITISGNATDTYKLAVTDALSITEYDNGTKGTTKTLTVNASGDWSCAVPFNGTDNKNAHKFKYEITLKDAAENSVTYKSTEMVVDTALPVITFDNDSETTVYSSSTTLKITGTITDDTFKEAHAYLYKKLNNVWSQERTHGNIELSATGTFEWSAYNLDDGEYRVIVQAWDKAGNIDTTVSPNVDYAEEATLKSVIIDNTPATSTVYATSGLYDEDGVVVANNYQLSDSETYYAKGAYTISGTISEENFDKSKVTLSVTKGNNSVTAPAITFSGADSKVWAFNGVTATAKDGTYRYTLSIQDKANHTSKYVIYVVYDETAPTLAVTNPEKNKKYTSAAANTIKADGTFRDTGIGLKEITYTLEAGTYNKQNSTWTWTNVKSDKEPIAEGNTSFAKDISSLISTNGEGKYRFTATVKDKLNHETSSGDYEFFYDQSAPTLVFDSLNSSYKENKVTVSGTARDTNALKSLVVKDGETVVLTKDYTNAKTTSDTWSKELTGLAEGSHKFVVTATDMADRETAKDQTVVIDTKAPTVTLDTTPKTGEDTKARSFTIRGTAKDDTTGVDSIKVVISDVTDSTKKMIVNPVVTENWFYTITYSDVASGASTVFETQGQKKIEVTAKDKAGNELTTPVSDTFVYDKADPILEVTANTIQTYMPQGGFAIKGTATDSYKLTKDSCLKVTEEYKASASAANWTTKTTDHVITVQNDDTWSLTVPVTPVMNGSKYADGVYRYVFTLTDTVGNTAGETTKEITVDTTAPVLSITAPATGTLIGEVYPKFEGKFTETVALKNIYFKFVEGTLSNGTYTYTAPTVTSVASFDSTWSTATASSIKGSNIEWHMNQQFKQKAGEDSGLPEGFYKLFAYAVDEAGNYNATAATAEYKVDMAAPVISSVKKDSQTGSEISEGKVFYYAKTSDGKLKLSGKILESNGLASFTYKVGDAGTPKNITIPAAATTSKDWAVEISGISENTDTQIIITAKDIAGRSDTKTYTVYCDTQAPVISITTPDSDYAVASDNSISWTGDGNGTYRFKGTVLDEASGIPGSKYYYLFTQTKLADADITKTTVNNEYTGQSFTSDQTLAVKRARAAGVLTEGMWYLYIYAQDAVGNEAKAERSFYVDKAAPAITTKLNGSALTSASSVTKAEAYAFNFNIAETNGLAEANPVIVSVTKDGTPVAASGYKVYYTPEGGSKTEAGTYTTNVDYSVELTAPQADAEYVYTISATDLAGKQTTISRTIRLDTTGPSIATSSPNFENWITSKTIQVIGTANDISGISGLYYVVNPASTPAAPAKGTSALTAANWTGANPAWTSIAVNSNWAIDLPSTQLADKADNKLYLAAVDTYGNVTALSDGTIKTLKIDTIAPTLEEEGIGTSGAQITASTAASGITLSGEFVDTTSGLKSLEIQDDDDAERIWTLSDFSADIATPNANGTTWNKTTGEWTQKVGVGAGTKELPDGVHLINITATDIAGNKAQKQRSVQVDTQSPSHGTLALKATTVPDYTDGSNKWFKVTSIGIQLPDVEDRLKNGYASGITTVEYSTNASSASDNSATWIGMTKGSETTDAANGNVKKATWTADVNCTEQGLNTIKVRVKDAAGNIADAGSLPVYIDTKIPDTASLVKIDDNASNLTQTKFVNGLNTIDAYILTEDVSATETLKSSGIAKVKLAKIGSTNASHSADGTQVSYLWYNKDEVTKRYYTDTTTVVANTTKAYTDGLCTTGEAAITAASATSITVGGKVYTLVPSSGVYKVTIATADFDSGTVVFSISDNVNNNADATKNSVLSLYTFQVQYDNEYPEAKITSVPAAINKTVTIGGTARDNQTITSLKVQYVESAADGTPKSGAQWTDYPTAPTGTASWTLNIDTQEKVGENLRFKDETYYTFRAVATDTANNTGNSGKTRDQNVVYDTANQVVLYINQDSDRPEITITNITLDSMTKASPYKFGANKVMGLIKDDDGISSAAGDVQYKVDDGAWTNLALSNGLFSFELDEGPKTILFKVTDAKGETFTSSDATTYSVTTPVITDGTNSYGTKLAAGTTTTASALYLRIDTKAPSVNTPEYTTKTEPAADDWKESINTALFGGTNNTFSLRQYATDANGIESVTATFERKDGDANTLKAADYTRALTKATTPATKTYSDGTYTGYETATPFNVSGFASGTRELTILVFDGSNSAKTVLNVSIDNTAPSLTLESHKNGDVINSSFFIRGNIQDGDNKTQVKMLVSTSPTKLATGDRAWNSATQLLGTTSMTWGAYFDGDIVQDGFTHFASQKNTFVELYGTSQNIELNSENAIVNKTTKVKYRTRQPFYFHLLVTDSLGNPATQVFNLVVDPQGDVPVITLVSPTAEETIQSGWIRLSGTAYDDKTIKGLYVEIDPNYNGTTFIPWNDTTHKPPRGATITSIYGSDEDNPYELLDERVDPSKRAQTRPTTKAIFISDALSWNIALNKQNELIGAANGTTIDNNDIAVRFYAVDVDGNISEPTDPFKLTIDSAAPKIGSSEPFYLKQFDDAGNVTASIEYVDGMWLKGEWYLVGSVEDESGINKVTVAIGDEDEHPATLTTDSGLTSKTWASTNTKGYVVKYKVGNAGANEAGELKYILTTEDKDATKKTKSKEFVIKYDNKPSDLADLERTYVNVQNSNGFYTLRSTVSEGSGESGFERVIFYFTRGTKVYDSYLGKEYKDAANKNRNTLEFKQTYEAGDIPLVKEDNLYWTTNTVSAISGKNITLNAANDNAHIGGIAKLGGTVYRITAISGTTVTVDGNPSGDMVGKTIMFAIGHVVDHLGAESAGKTKVTAKNAYGTGYYSDMRDDDGDRMVETVSTQGTVTTWSGSINSQNIPDGPITIHYVAYDKAGNVSYKEVDSVTVGSNTYAATVCNNAPRLAGVKIWTDYDGNGTPSESEYTYKYVLQRERPIGGVRKLVSTMVADSDFVVSGNGFDYDSTETEPTAAATLRDTSSFTPEIVGGNGDLYYTYKIGTKSQFAAKSGYIMTGYGANKIGTGRDQGEDITTEDDNHESYINSKETDPIPFDKSNFGTGTGKISSNGMYWFEYTIWDSTEGCKAWTASDRTTGRLSATMRLAVNVDYFDQTPPVAYIRPFHWNSKEDNSLSWNNGEAEGHIELEADLPSSFTTGGSGVNDRDPKVSGKIKIDGYAYDNIRLKSLYVQFKDHAGFTTNNNLVYKLGTTYTGIWSTETGTGWSMTAEDVYANANGHCVHWTLTLDTSKIANIADTNLFAKVIAVDERGTGTPSITGVTGITGNQSTAPGTTQTAIKVAEWKDVKSETNAVNNYYLDPVYRQKVTSETPDNTVVYKSGMTTYYKMDVVPYITGIERDPTRFNTNRARSGAIPLLRSETLTSVKGFNLGDAVRKNNSAFITLNITPKADGTGTAVDMGALAVKTANTELTFTLPATAKDGYMNVTVNGIKSLNNINDDSKAYNKENTENIASTNYWTDTRHIRVWKNDANDYFKGSTLPIFPAMSMGSSGTLYASFSNYSESGVFYSTVATNGTQTATSNATQVFYGFDPPEETDICVSGTGTINVVYNANYHGGYDTSWVAGADQCGGLYMYDTNAQSINVGRDNRKVHRFELFYHNRMLQQFKNLRVKRVDSANTGIVHVAYYDRTTNSIHYSEIASNWDPGSKVNNNKGTARSNHELAWVNIDGGWDAQDNNYVATANYSDGRSIYLTDARFEGTKRSSGTGESVGLTLTSSNYPVVVYYDATNSILKVARGLSATPKGNVDTWKVQDVLATTDSNYKTQVDYIAAEIDSAGILHIVFQNGKGQLCYIKSKNASATGTTAYIFGASTVIADSATNIDLTLKGTVPYISYLTKINSYDGMNIAYWDSTLDLDCNGTAEGGWETMTAPLNYKVTNVKSCIEAHPTPANATWEAAVGFTPGDLYRVAYYVGNGSGH